MRVMLVLYTLDSYRVSWYLSNDFCPEHIVFRQNDTYLYASFTL